MDAKLQTANLVKDIFRRFDQAGQGTISREDLERLLAVLGLADEADILLREVSKAGSGKLLYRDFVDRVFGLPTEQVSIHAAVAGDEVMVPLSSQAGTVMARTTTEVKMKLQDGNEVWFDVEDVEGGPVRIHEVVQGGMAKPRGAGKCVVIERTTGEVKLLLPDGREVWHDVEDLEDEGEQHVSMVGPGSNARVLPKSLRASVKHRTTSDAVVIFQNGSEALVGIEDLEPSALAPSPEAEARLRSIFDLCKSGSEEVINKRGLIKICRKDASVADFFGLASNIRQEDGSKDALERLFQAMDTDGDRQLSWSEFRSFFLECMAGRSQAGVMRSITCD